MTNRLLDRIQGCLLGAQIGDAMGMPWEGMKAHDIAHVTKGLGVMGFTAPGQHSLSFLRGLNAGDTTDDWALAAANARALIRGGGNYIPRLIVLEHLIAFRQSSIGWGRTTKKAMEELDAYEQTQHILGRGPGSTASMDQDRPNSGCGNGVAMKIAPLAIRHVTRHRGSRCDQLAKTVLRHGSLTHPDVRASVAALGVAFLTTRFLLSSDDTFPEGSSAAAYEMLDHIRIRLASIEDEIASPPDSGRFTQRLGRILDARQRDLLNPNKRQVKTADLVRVLGNGYHALESCAFAIAMALRHPNDFRSALLNTVNAGGDADTNASMVGAMVGARVGLSGIPEEWRTFSPNFQEAIELANQLYALK